MKKITLFLVLTVFLLTSCQSAHLDVITLDEVVSSFEDQQLDMEENENLNNNRIFQMKLNGVYPSSYELEGKLLSVYIYHSVEEREKGLEDFHHKTATMNLVSYNVYKIDNIFIFYVYEHDRSKDVKVDDAIKAALSKVEERNE
ncbi:hypothetical protein [Bacillus weihaiensis]|uniref:Lipoprotein n=1 Tax=Bacillus weihaiensis TaxID=1547283 RepID=A0A1L3MVZ9_9BACI|nr:hypothetical protein [Bacillus weihaiensis]APH06521.1 hypothetical protein A9C19_18305 [Bacillus weihaiensis]